MTLTEILNKIRRYYPKAATWTNAEIISILNDEQREIFRELQLKEIYEFNTIEDQVIYSLPSNLSIEFIEYVGLTKDITITADSTFQEYKFAEMNESLTGYRYFDALSGIGLYPVDVGSVRIIFKKRPALFTELELSATPDLNEDWHRILVYAAIAEIAGAGSNPDVSTVNNYTVKYNELLSQIKLNKYKRYPKTKDWRS